MTHRNIVVGQPIDADKLAFSRELRRTMTLSQKRLWGSIRGRQLDGLKSRRQQIIDGFIADFFCSIAGLVIELDGASHDSQADYDANRDIVMSERGLKVIRISNDRILFKLEAVLSEISIIAGQTTFDSPDLSPLSETERGSRRKPEPHDRNRPDRG